MVSACVEDIDGNSACSEPEDLNAKSKNALTVTSVTPLSSSHTPRSSKLAISAQFSLPLDVSTVTLQNVSLVQAATKTAPSLAIPLSRVTYQAATKSISIQPKSPLASGSYKVVLSAAIKSSTATSMAADYAWSFDVSPATDSWSVATSGDWNTGSNWSLGTPPAAGDSVVINKPGVTVTLSSDSYQGGSSTQIDNITVGSTSTLTIAGGNLSVAGTGTISNALNLSSGSLAGPGAVTVSGAMKWTGGGITGTLDIPAKATLAINTPAYPGHNFYLNGGTINNSGTVTQTFGGGAYNGFELSNGGVINNLAGGVWNASGDVFIYPIDTSATAFNNAGTFNKVPAPGSTTDTGTSTWNLSFGGAGAVNIQAGTLNFGVPATMGNLTMTGGGLTGSGAITVSKTFNWTGGALTGTGTFTIGTLTLSPSGSVSLQIGAGQILNVTSGATLAGALALTYPSSVENAAVGKSIQAMVLPSGYSSPFSSISNTKVANGNLNAVYGANELSFIVGTPGGQPQTITFGALANQTYGVAPIPLTATASSGLPVTYTVSGLATVSGSKLSITGAGTVTVTASQPGNSTYAPAPTVSQSFTVAKAVLTATATSMSRPYGTANPTLTYGLTGFVNGDSASVVGGSATLTTTATSTSPVGTYPIIFSTEALTAANYTFTYVAGTLTVSGGVAQTITFAALANQTYGVAPFILTATASSSLPVTYSVKGPATVSGSTLTVTGAGTVMVTASQAGNSTYLPATPVTQSFTVAKAPLTATAVSVSRVYGTANPTLRYALSGFVNGDTAASVGGSATLTTTATSTSPVGTYPITFATENLTATNYTFTYVAGTLTVTGGASQTITFGALANQTYGASPIILTATASSGLPVSYTVTGPATISGSILTIIGAGTVTVTAFQPGNSTYAPAPKVSQSFSVAKAVLTATATNLSRAYGAVNPMLTYAVSGFVNGDSSSVVGGSATLTTTATSASPVGTYPITFATEKLTAANYIFTYVAGTLTVVGGVSQTITFGPLPNQTYGASSITLTATASSGLPVSFSVAGPATISGSTLRITGAGYVTVTASQPGNSTYAAAPSVSQSFTVAKAVLTATAANLSRQYGAANPTLTYAVTGFVNGDTSAVVTGSATLTTTATTTSPVGTYPITFATENLTATNYTFAYVAGTLTVTVATTVPAPTFNPPGGTYTSAQSVILSDGTSGATIYYTTDGSTPGVGSTVYSKPVQVTATETINAIAILNGVSSTVSTATYTITTAQCTTINYADGFTSTGLSLNGGATVKNNLLQLTDGGFFEARSAFYSTAVPVTNFTTDFTFQLLNPLGDGITFTIQSNNAQEVGQAGGGLGYAGIPNSVAVKADLFDNNGEGFDSTGLYLNGAYPSTPAISLEPGGINLHSGHIFAVHIVYANNTATGTITDTVTSQSGKMSVHGDISKFVGDTAYVGFTGGTGVLTATQNILSWSYSGGAGCAAP